MIHFHADLNLIIAETGDENRPARIAGIAVPWDVVATVSGGQRVKFLRGAFDLNQKPAKLLENHDMSQLRGVVNSLSDSDAGLEFEATLARTRASADVVALLQAGAYDSVSVGANPVAFKFDKAGVMIVSKAQMIELSLVAIPAFSEAVITEIAASADPEESEEEETQDTPEEEIVSDQLKAESPESATTPTSPLLYASARREFKLPSPAEYMSAYIRGGHDFAQMQDNIRAAAPDVVTGDLDGILPEIIVSPTYNNFRGLRPVVDAIGARAMPQGGKIFIRPSVTTHTSMAVQSTQNTDLQSGTFVVTDNPVTKGTYGGYVEISEQSLDFTQPEVLGLILDDMARIYANLTDDVATTDLNAGATTTAILSNANLADPAKVVEFMYDSASTILSASNGNLPTHLFLSADMFAALGKLSDTSDRPLFPQTGPMNAYGSMSPGSVDTVAFGLRVVVDRNFGNGTIIVGEASGFEIFEQQKGAISIDNPSQLSRTIAFRGYFATLMIDATKFVNRVAA